MGWFEEQIEYRKQQESELLSESFQDIALSVLGHKIGDGYTADNGVRDAVSQLLKYFKIREKQIPEKINGLDAQLEYLLSPAGVLYRKVHLDKGWYSDAVGVMLSSLKEDGSVIAIIPENSGRYVYKDPHTGTKKRINAKEAEKISADAMCFYRPMPQEKMKDSDLWKFMLSCLNTWDFVSFGLAALAITLVGLLIPKLNQILTGEVLEYGSNQLLAAVMIFMLCATVGRLMFNSIYQLLQTRISTKLSVNVESATMMRVLNLPAEFFKDYSTGELSQYLGYMSSICTTVINSTLSVGITGIFSLAYFFQIFSYAKGLVLPSLAASVLTFCVSLAAAAAQKKMSKQVMEESAKENGLLYSLIRGVQKIRLAGAEKRAFAKWAKSYAEKAQLVYNPPLILSIYTVIVTAISLVGTIVMYYIAVKTNVSVANYYAFTSAYAYVTTAFSSLTTAATSAAAVTATMNIVRPLLEAKPESDKSRETVESLSGSIEVSHVSFSYKKDSPLILDDLSINIPAGQYVAIVGRTGCGKSTLLRLLLGFEKPNVGSIFFDHRDANTLDMHSVRRNIGTVMQDGKLFSGSIYQNIVISAPMLTLDDAWAAAEMSGLADDIRKMPMGMNTMIAEGAGGVSGGQKQRLMIARAVAPKPKILLLDEATSALDNITQKHVSDALDGLHCTRIVIAHRLSTIRHCDRILVLDHGKIIEDGTYDQLIEKKGFFADLVERQRL